MQNENPITQTGNTSNDQPPTAPPQPTPITSTPMTSSRISNSAPPTLGSPDITPSTTPSYVGEPVIAQPPSSPDDSTVHAAPLVQPMPVATTPISNYNNQENISINSPQAAQGKKKKRRESGVLSLILTIVVALVLVQAINHLLFQSYRVVGESMLPTLHEGDLLIISKFGKTSAKLQGKIYEPERNDIVVFKSPRDDIQLVKRVIGLPGERVVVSDGKVTVYNDRFPEGFDPDRGTDHGSMLPYTSGKADITIPKDHIFVSGDNREGGNSLDSRNALGTVPEELISGRLALRIWPLSSAEFF